MTLTATSRITAVNASRDLFDIAVKYGAGDARTSLRFDTHIRTLAVTISEMITPHLRDDERSWINAICAGVTDLRREDYTYFAVWSAIHESICADAQYALDIYRSRYIARDGEKAQFTQGKFTRVILPILSL